MSKTQKLQQATRFSLIAFGTLWGAFLIPEIFGMQIRDVIENGVILKAGWYGFPYFATTAITVGYFVVRAVFSWFAYSEEF